MPTDQTRNVSLTAELNAFIRAQVASGQYQNASEVVRASLRLLQQQEQRNKRRQTPPGHRPMHGNGISGTGFGPPGGEMGALIRAHDWSTTPLGPPTTWPQSLKTAINLMLQARQPAYIAWGPEQISLYNDGYIPILGTKHPAGLGQPAAMLWAEIWDTLGPDQRGRARRRGAVVRGHAVRARRARPGGELVQLLLHTAAGRRRSDCRHLLRGPGNDREGAGRAPRRGRTRAPDPDVRAGAKLCGTAGRARASVRARQSCLSPVGRAPRGPREDHRRGASGRRRAGLSRICSTRSTAAARHSARWRRSSLAR